MLHQERSSGVISGLHTALSHVAIHSSVNHSVEFVALSGTHTQNIESYWNRVKIRIKRINGCAEIEISGYLDERGSAFNNICSDIATVSLFYLSSMIQ